MKKGKKMSLILTAIVLAGVGVAGVSASLSLSHVVTLNMSSHNITMEDLTGDIHYGMAKAMQKPSNAMTINWKVYKKSWISETQVGSGFMDQLDDMAWHATGKITNTANGDYKHNFYSNGYYYGNVQGTNQ